MEANGDGIKPPPKSAPKSTTTLYTEEMRQVLERAQQGDKTVLPDLKKLLDDRPELWREMGNLVAHAEEAVLTLAAGKNLLAREAIRRRMMEVKTELLGQGGSPLERLLVDRIAVTWLQTYLADIDLAAAQLNTNGATARARHAQQRLDGAHRRYLAAIKQLALVRKLLKPTPSPLDLARPVTETAPTKARHAHPRTRSNFEELIPAN
jgi:hypothetical protein